MTDENDRIERATAAAIFGAREVDRDELLTDDDRAERAFASGLFSHPARNHEPQPAPEIKPGNHVPREGSQPPSPDKTDRNFLRAVFGYDPA
jgi:hypothetical protein